ncbi:hypothetical protein C7M84_009523 [Penaeus vannamei]|uniref:Uncharacterized protein n=1 Tax=Penaeus vannamei TaxID=6689 RepID=A0A423T709_PENVA|nr:hypothetical protein C7M84_009523 [Penaeus vannamei]
MKVRTSQPPECSEECHKWSKKIRIKRSGKDKAKEALRKDQGVTMAGQTRPTPHKPSNKLSEEENQAVFKMLDLRCLAQATAVVQMYGRSHRTIAAGTRSTAGWPPLPKTTSASPFSSRFTTSRRAKGSSSRKSTGSFLITILDAHFHQFESDVSCYFLLVYCACNSCITCAF